ncbi:MAG: biopolymer transporter ExbD [Burkholderiales bacterium]|nr:biopolymer transporter ExbD [Burkholderiales bacterium]
MKRRSRKSTLINQMNVVPYIDVMLVLLIIFMVTAPMFVPGVINLPSVGRAAQVTQQPVEISISKNGSYTVTQNNKTNAVDNIEHLITQVQSLATGDTPVVISADKEVEYNNVITVVDRLYAAQIKKVALVVKERQ